MRLEPVYQMVFRYSHEWSVALAGDSTESNHLFLAEGHCDGRISGQMQGVNHPRRRGDGTYCPDFHGVISTGDGATVLFQCGGTVVPIPKVLDRSCVGSRTSATILDTGG
jgi:hypothetical protein